MADPAWSPTCVVVIGASGEVGSALAAGLGGSGHEVRGFDRERPRQSNDWWLMADLVAPGQVLLDTLAAADIVVLAVPEAAALAGAEALFEAVGPDTLIVDTLSVKTAWLDRALCLCEGELLSINPMFAPSLGFSGRPVAVVDARPGPRSQWFRAELESWGSKVVVVEASAHDRVAASLQVATHAAVLAFGAALDALDHDVDGLWELAPPPHRTALALLGRIVGGDPHVYFDVQAHNPHGPEARAAVLAGLAELDGLSRAGDEDGFEDLVNRLRDRLGPRLDELGRLCATLFELR